MSRVYNLSDDLGPLFTVINNNSEFSKLKEFNVRFVILFVTNTNRDGELLPSFDLLPYKVKINSMKDRCLKHKDVEIHIDEPFYDTLTDSEKEAFLYSALNQIEIKEKNEFPVIEDDGIIKMSVKKPDMVFAGFSEVCEKYGSLSPEIILFKQMLARFNTVLYL